MSESGYDPDTTWATSIGDTPASFGLADLKDCMMKADFHLNYEQTQPEPFVEYEHTDREWAEYFGFVRKKRRIDHLYVGDGYVYGVDSEFLNGLYGFGDSPQIEPRPLFRPDTLAGIPVTYLTPSAENVMKPFFKTES